MFCRAARYRLVMSGRAEHVATGGGRPASRPRVGGDGAGKARARRGPEAAGTVTTARALLPPPCPVGAPSSSAGRLRPPGPVLLRDRVSCSPPWQCLGGAVSASRLHPGWRGEPHTPSVCPECGGTEPWRLGRTPLGGGGLCQPTRARLLRLQNCPDTDRGQIDKCLSSSE